LGPEGSKIKNGRKMAPLANGALCLSTPKHTGKSGTATINRLVCNSKVNRERTQVL
jgi:hypothetical protein